MTLDNHQYFEHYKLPKHDWIDDDMSAIRRNFTPDDLKLILGANSMDGCIAIHREPEGHTIRF